MTPEIVDMMWETIEEHLHLRTDDVWHCLWDVYFKAEDNNLRGTINGYDNLCATDCTFYMLVLLSEGETL